jgi:hypothetical protein
LSASSADLLFCDVGEKNLCIGSAKNIATIKGAVITTQPATASGQRPQRRRSGAGLQGLRPGEGGSDRDLAEVVNIQPLPRVLYVWVF